MASDELPYTKKLPDSSTVACQPFSQHFGEADDLHHSATLGALQQIDFVHRV